MNSFNVLIVDDEPSYCRSLARALRRKGIDADVVHDGSSCIEKVRNGSYEVVLLDNRLPDTRGLQLIPTLGGLMPGCSILMMTAYGSFPEAVQAIHLGAEDFVDKATSLAPIVERVLEVKSHRKMLGDLRDSGAPRAHSLIGGSPGIRRVIARIQEVATSPETTVLILGESGSGKEVAARQLHHLSGKPWETFVAVDCLSLPIGLAESHLFGHQKGSFTGAYQDQAGLLETAADGTVLLDEIGDMDIGLQGRLLRTLEARTFRRVGSTSERTLKARVVTATNKDLASLAREGRFRLDLYHRLSVFPIEIPPLRDRGDDVSMLAEYFLAHFSPLLGKQGLKLGKEAADALMAYDFPGNVRELKNIVERAVILARGPAISPRDLPERVQTGKGEPTIEDSGTRPGVSFVPGVDTMASVEKKLIVRALQMAGGVKSRAARMLGMSRYQLLRRMERYSIDPVTPTGQPGGRPGGGER